MRRGVVAVTTAVIVAVAAMSPTLAVAKKKPPAKKPPAPGQERCEAAPAGGKGPIAGAEVEATKKCFTTFGEALNETNLPAGGAAQGCSSASADFNRTEGKGLAGTAEAGRKDIEQTKKAKVGYFRAEAEWYAEHGVLKHRAANRTKVENVVDAIGKVAFDVSGYYAELSAEAAALQNNDCGEAQTRDQNLVEIGKKVGRTDLPNLRKALSDLP